MNSYERLYARISGKQTDKMPNLNILMGFAAKAYGVPYSKFCTDPFVMAQANIFCHEEFDVDIVTVMSDPYAETSAFGAQIEYPNDSNPVCKTMLLESREDIKKLKVKNVDESKRLKDRIEVISIYKDALKGKCPIAGWVEGALAEFVDLRGMNDAFIDLMDEPGFAEEVMEICYEQARMFALAQIDAGADIIGVGDAAASVVGARLYKEHVLPFEKRIIADIQAAGALAKLHICGNITDILDAVAETKADIVDIDWMVDFNTACMKLGPKICTNGNYDPVRILLQGNIDTVKEASLKCMTEGMYNFMVCAGCEVPPDTAHENLKASNIYL